MTIMTEGDENGVCLLVAVCGGAEVCGVVSVCMSYECSFVCEVLWIIFCASAPVQCTNAPVHRYHLSGRIGCTKLAYFYIFGVHRSST